MTERRIRISVPLDTEGFMTLVCSLCGERFKIRGEQYESENCAELYCPGCGLSGPRSSFLSDEVHEAAQIAAENAAREMVNDFMKDLGRAFQGSKFIKVKPGRPLSAVPEKKIVEMDDLEKVSLDCCSKDIKTSFLRKSTSLYCPFCGGKSQ